MKANIAKRFRSLTGCWGRTFRATAICFLATSTSFAAPPDVKFLFPSGLKQGTTRTLKVNGKPGTAPVRSWSASEGLFVEPNESGEELTVTAAAEVAPGLHWIRLFNDEGASQLLPVLVGVVAETTEAEVEKHKSDETTTLPVTISGVLAKSGEVDAFPVTLEQGQTLIASVESHRSLGSPADAVLQLVTPDGFVVDQNDDFHGFDPQLVFTARQSGNFTIRLFAFPAEPNSTIRFAGGSDYRYRLTLTTGPFIDHSVPLSVSEEDHGKVRHFGWNIPEDQQSSPSALSAFPGSVTAHQAGSRAEATVVEEPLVDGAGPQNLSLGSALSGHIARQGETDTFAFEASKGQRLRLKVNARSYGSPLDSVVRIVDADGKIIKEADDVSRENVDAQLDVKIPAEGTYRVEITDRYGHGGMRYVYELRLKEEQPQVVLSVKEDRYTIKDGKPVEIPVTIDRQGGFSEEVSLTVRGLPEGVSAEPAISAAKGDSSKEVKLKLTSKTAVGFNGPIQIIGAIPDEAEVVATTPTPSAALTTSKLWLTVVHPSEAPDDAPGKSPDP